MRFACSLVFVSLLCAAGPASAQEAPADRTIAAARPVTASAIEASPAAERKRPAALVPLYVSFAALQVMDVQSTRRALSSGAGREANAVMAPIVRHPAAFIAVKAGVTAASIWGTEKMWKKNRAAAIAFMAVANSAMATIVAHNYSVR